MNTAEFGNDGPDGDKIMHANLETPDGSTLMASDTPPGMEEASGNNIAISLSGDGERQAARLLDQLTDGAKVTMPLERGLG